MSKFSEGGGAILHGTIVSTIASLAAGGVNSIVTKIDAARNRGFRVLKIEGFVAIKAGVVDEHVVFGLAGPNLTNTEVKEALDADPQDPNDIPANEQAMRPVWPLTMLQGEAAQVAVRPTAFSLNPRWSYPEETFMSFYVQNPDDSAISAGSQQIIGSWKAFGVWLND